MSDQDGRRSSCSSFEVCSMSNEQKEWLANAMKQSGREDDFESLIDGDTPEKKDSLYNETSLSYLERSSSPNTEEQYETDLIQAIKTILNKDNIDILEDEKMTQFIFLREKNQGYSIKVHIESLIPKMEQSIDTSVRDERLSEKSNQSKKYEIGAEAVIKHMRQNLIMKEEELQLAISKAYKNQEIINTLESKLSKMEDVTKDANKGSNEENTDTSKVTVTSPQNSSQALSEFQTLNKEEHHKIYSLEKKVTLLSEDFINLDKTHSLEIELVKDQIKDLRSNLDGMMKTFIKESKSTSENTDNEKTSTTCMSNSISSISTVKSNGKDVVLSDAGDVRLNDNGQVIHGSEAFCPVCCASVKGLNTYQRNIHVENHFDEDDDCFINGC